LKEENKEGIANRAGRADRARKAVYREDTREEGLWGVSHDHIECGLVR